MTPSAATAPQIGSVASAAAAVYVEASAAPTPVSTLASGATAHAPVSANAEASTADAHDLGEVEREEDEEEEEEDDDDEIDDEEDEDEDAAQTWIEWYCSIRSNAFLVEVDEEFITDDFNMTGLAAEVPYYDHALDTILDNELRTAEPLTEAQQETIDAAAELLYGLAHARFLLTARGLAAVLEKFNVAAYGRCPRVHCDGQAMLPVGTSDAPRKAAVALFCPRCNDIYHPKSAKTGLS